MSNVLHSFTQTLFQKLGLGHDIAPAQLFGHATLSILVLAETLICFFWIYSLASLGENYAFLLSVPYIYLVLSYIFLLIFYRLHNQRLFTFVQLIMLLVIPFFMQWLIGGFTSSGGIAIWGILSPVGALLILGGRQSTSWFLLFLGLVGVSWWLDPIFSVNKLPLDVVTKTQFVVTNTLGLALVLYGVIRHFQSQERFSKQQLLIEQKHAEDLLLNILPPSIVKRLKQGEVNIADTYDDVTVMFVDIADFTGISSRLKPQELVKLLNIIFSRFDQLIEDYGLEKIKTIGDAYMVVGGATHRISEHAIKMVEVAYAMIAATREISEQTGMVIDIRVGINTGVVTAGVIGQSKFTYDMWGDTVNVASRLENTAPPNSIQVSAMTYELIKNHYEVELRGNIKLKGRGLTNAYLVLNKK